MQSDPDPNPPIWINYFYFGLLFAMLIVLCVSGVIVREDLGGSKIFFLFYSIGEATLEVMLFIFCGWLIRRYLSKMWFNFYIGLTFWCFIFHCIDFMLDRILNYTIWETLDFVFEGGPGNFVYLLKASGVSLWVWFILFIALALIPLIGIFVYRATDWLANKNPFGIRLGLMVQIFFCIPVALFLWDFSASRVLHREAHHSFIHSLPWKVTFFHPRTPMLHLSKPLKPIKTQKQIEEAIDQYAYRIEHKPNIYLIIVESLRNDIICREITPNLAQFKLENVHGDLSLSNANMTQYAWFSILHSSYPFYWNDIKKERGQAGSPALQLLRKIGYQIRVYTSADLRYFQMDELLFGKDCHLATSVQYFPHLPPKEAWESDKETIQALASDLAKPEYQEGQCFIFFWDATHFDYTWPKEETLFTPISSGMNYFKAYHSQANIEAIKNSYKNAVHFIDTLFGQFLSVVPNKDQSLIVFTGDHGEEFFEHGHLFHISQLSDVQIQIPILFKLPIKPPSPELVTQMDIFPTFIDALLSKSGSTASILEGQSLYLKDRWPYVIISRFKPTHGSCEFCIHNKDHKMIVRFTDHRIFHSKFLEIISLRTTRDKIFHEYKKDLDGWIRNEFGNALERIFPRGDTE